MSNLGIISSSIKRDAVVDPPGTGNTTYNVWGLKQRGNANTFGRIRVDDTKEATVRFNTSTGYADLNSEILGATDSTPDGTLVSTFINGGDARVIQLFNQKNIADTGTRFVQETWSLMPEFATAGVQVTKDGKPALGFDGNRAMKKTPAFTFLEVTGVFSLFSRAAARVADTFGVIISTSLTNNQRLAFVRDSRTVNGFNLFVNTTTNAFPSSLDTPNATTNTIIQSAISDGTDMQAFNDGNAGNVVTPSGTFTNDTLRLGDQFTDISRLDGFIQEVRIYDTDETANRTAIETELTNY